MNVNVTNLAPETENIILKLRIARGWTAERAAYLLEIDEALLHKYEDETLPIPKDVHYRALALMSECCG